MSKGSELKTVIQKIVRDVIKGAELSNIVYGTLIDINPPTFRFEGLDPLSEEFIITPKYKVFLNEDLGNKYVFMKNTGGQTYFYLYEAQNQGENGVEYSWEGRIENCNLIGTCSHGPVVVTHGTIEKSTHERRKS